MFCYIIGESFTPKLQWPGATYVIDTLLPLTLCIRKLSQCMLDSMTMMHHSSVTQSLKKWSVFTSNVVVTKLIKVSPSCAKIRALAFEVYGQAFVLWGIKRVIWGETWNNKLVEFDGLVNELFVPKSDQKGTQFGIILHLKNRGVHLASS